MDLLGKFEKSHLKILLTLPGQINTKPNLMFFGDVSMKLLCSFFLIFLLPFSVLAETIILNDGTRIEADIVQRKAESIIIEKDTMQIALPLNKIKNITVPEQQSSQTPSSFFQEQTPFEKAEELYHAGKFKQAYPIYQQILQENPQNADAGKRMQEIKNRLTRRMKQEGGTDIKPLTDNQVISTMASRKQQTRETPAQPEQTQQTTPFSSAPDNSSQSPFGSEQQPSRSTSSPSPFQTKAPSTDQPGNQASTPFQSQQPQTSSSSSPFEADSSSPFQAKPQTSATGRQPSQQTSPFSSSESAASPFQSESPQQKPPMTSQDARNASPFNSKAPSEQSSSPFQASPQNQQPSLPPAPDTNTQGSPFSTGTPSAPQPDNTSSPFSSAPSQPPETSTQSTPGSPFMNKSRPDDQDTQNLPPLQTNETEPQTQSATSSPFSESRAGRTNSTQSSPFSQSSSQSPFSNKPVKQSGLPPMNPSKESPFPKQTAQLAEQKSPAPFQEVSAVPAEGEFRGMWISRFEWPSTNPGEIKSKIKNYLDKMASANYNAVLFQVRGQGDVLYPSPYEPWSSLVGGKDPGFDPLQFALDEAHSRNLEFHAYVNAFPVWQGEEPPPHSNPEHPYWRFCQPDSDPCMACYDKSGSIMKPQQGEADSYVYFSPGVPEVDAYLRKVIMDIVNRYEVDGIHLDRIRYPGANYSWDPVSRKRFESEGNPDNLTWEDWQRDQITRFLNNLYGQIAAGKPDICISVAGWGIYDKTRYPGYSGFSSGYHQYYQDTFAWAQKGVIDAIAPMIYWDIPDPKPNYDTLAKDFIENSGGRHIYAANWLNQSRMAKEEYKNQIQLMRNSGGEGNVGFSVGGFIKRNLASYFAGEIYQQPVETPPMPWKKDASTGMITGKIVRKDNGEPVTDAWITVEDKAETTLSSSDGFFCILNLAADQQVSLRVSKQGLGEVQTEPVTVKGAEVIDMKIALGE